MVDEQRIAAEDNPPTPRPRRQAGSFAVIDWTTASNGRKVMQPVDGFAPLGKQAILGKYGAKV
jgi:hypothetical protein